MPENVTGGAGVCTGKAVTAHEQAAVDRMMADVQKEYQNRLAYNPMASAEDSSRMMQSLIETAYGKPGAADQALVDSYFSKQA